MVRWHIHIETAPGFNEKDIVCNEFSMVKLHSILNIVIYKFAAILSSGDIS